MNLGFRTHNQMKIFGLSLNYGARSLGKEGRIHASLFSDRSDQNFWGNVVLKARGPLQTVRKTSRKRFHKAML